jgi:hypothetical protein
MEDFLSSHLMQSMTKSALFGLMGGIIYKNDFKNPNDVKQFCYISVFCDVYKV